MVAALLLKLLEPSPLAWVHRFSTEFTQDQCGVGGKLFWGGPWPSSGPPLQMRAPTTRAKKHDEQQQIISPMLFLDNQRERYLIDSCLLKGRPVEAVRRLLDWPDPHHRQE